MNISEIKMDIQKFEFHRQPYGFITTQARVLKYHEFGGN